MRLSRLYLEIAMRRSHERHAALDPVEETFRRLARAAHADEETELAAQRERLRGREAG